MDYYAGWGNRRNRDGTAPPVLNIHLWGRKTVPEPFHRLAPFHPLYEQEELYHQISTDISRVAQTYASFAFVCGSSMARILIRQDPAGAL